jgi:hypothetical protein
MLPRGCSMSAIPPIERWPLYTIVGLSWEHIAKGPAAIALGPIRYAHGEAEITLRAPLATGR